MFYNDVVLLEGKEEADLMVGLGDEACEDVAIIH